MQVFVTFALIRHPVGGVSVTRWPLPRGRAFFGVLDKLFLKGRDARFGGGHLLEGRGHLGVRLHHLPGAFAAITCGLIVVPLPSA